MRPKIIGALAMGLGLLAQTSAWAQKANEWGVVLKDNTPLRAAAGPNYYAVGKLKAGTLVKVTDVLFNWSKVEVPKGTQSYIHQQHVDRRGDGSVGVVNGSYVEVFAIGIDAQNASPEDAYINHGLVPKGSTVKIIDEVDGNYLIESPPGAYAFLQPGSLRRATDAEVQKWQAEHAAPAVPATDAGGDAPVSPATENQTISENLPDPNELVDGQSGESGNGVEGVVDAGVETLPETETEATPETTPGVEVGTEQPDVAVDGGSEIGGMAVPGNGVEEAVDGATNTDAVNPNDVATPAVDGSENTIGLDGGVGKDGAGTAVTPVAGAPALAKVEAEMLSKFLLPAESQPLDAMEAAYKGLQTDPSLGEEDLALVQTRLNVIASNRRLAQTIKQLRAAQQAIEVARAEEAAQPTLAPNRYDQIGMLLGSSLYDGVSLPKLYRLVDPTSQRTIAYIEPGEGLVGRKRLDAMLGKVVGLAGRESYDASLRRRVFVPKVVEPIRPQTPEPAAATQASEAAASATVDGPAVQPASETDATSSPSTSDTGE